ncbi:ABC transporter ATP-binding protein [Halobellus litoreus]|uniref:Molybdate/tungstate import ATP-binding protein WtpC n=1 Tax=Halobellus litoreus TaxID=755310 RepID=A0ABD6DSR5_9EURY|nr:ABC transporter ATP-binding protein [Halobellus litoreus]
MQLTLENVRKAYGETVALGREGEDREGDGRGISFEIDDGEFFTLVGPSGCGKTTTLRLVAGFEPPTGGSIRFDGREMRGVPPESRSVGVVFQNYALFPHLSVAENVAYGLRFSDPPGGVSRDERVADLLELVDLPEAGDRDPTELSGGQQQRIALARALAPGPDLLLLDEPMSALDARLRERLRMQIKEIQSTLGITTLYVTHDQEEALAISDRVAVMNDGAVEQVGTPQAVYRRPATRFVAEFVGDNNVFEGEVVSVRGRDEACSAHERDDGKQSASARESGESPVETKGVRSDVVGAETTDDRGERVWKVDVDVDGVRVVISTRVALSGGDRIVFCVRPEAMRLLGTESSRGETAGIEKSNGTSESETGGFEKSSGTSRSETNILDATVTGAEFLGDATRTYLRWNDRGLTVQSTDPPTGDVRVGFDCASAHVVDRVDD